ncbi:MAG: ABC transporter ATP-binding protein [Armatimonadetes bacterium]|nr:ABC transporter ATP-binding protein [Armatimonadota bacterium]
MEAPPIRVQDLYVRYTAKNGKSVDAVRNLSFEVQPGEIVGFLGPNGAGKSSTIKVLMGFVTELKGSAEIFGEPVGSLVAKAQTGYLPEVAMYYPFLTPMETLRLYGELQGLTGKALKTESEHLLELVGLGQAMTKQNRTLSKGMLQRVGIAQSLLGNPKLLILDEVTSGLDPVGRRELRDVLRARQAEGTTLFFSSHELSEVDMLCDRILLVNKGELIDERDMTGLKEHLRNYVLTYSGSATMLGLTDDWREEDSFKVARFPSKESLLEGISRIHQSSGAILDVVAEEGSLEDYFVEAVQAA